MSKYKVGFRYNDGKQEYEITKVLSFSSVPWYESRGIGTSPEMYYAVSEETVDRLTIPRIARPKFEIGARVNDGYCSGTVVKINVGEILGKTTTSYEVELDATEGSQRLITCEYHEDELEFNETKYKPIVPNETTMAAIEEAREMSKEHCIVNKPKHYMLMPGVEVRDICKAMTERMTENGYSAFFCSDYVQFLQYVLRFDEKNGIEDLQKAKFYLDKLIEGENE